MRQIFLSTLILLLPVLLACLNGEPLLARNEAPVSAEQTRSAAALYLPWMRTAGTPPSPTPTHTSTPSPTSTRTPTPTPSPSPTSTPTPTPHPSADKWALWSNGTQLRGANIYQRRIYPELDGPDFMGPGPLGPPFTQQDFDQLAAWGANYVNISHPGLFTEDPPYKLDPDAQANLDRLLEMAANANLYAVITFRTGPGRSEFWAFWGEDTESDPEEGWFDPAYYNNRVWGDAAAQDAWVAMWRYTAQRYKDNPIVVGYDLMCEPNSNEVGSYPLFRFHCFAASASFRLSERSPRAAVVGYSYTLACHDAQIHHRAGHAPARRRT